MENKLKDMRKDSLKDVKLGIVSATLITAGGHGRNCYFLSYSKPANRASLDLKNLFLTFPNRII